MSTPQPADSDRPAKDARQSRLARRFKVGCVLQAAIFMVFAFGDIGFDKPGRFGLDAGHGLLLLVAQALLVVHGLILAVRTRRLAYWIAQLFVIALVVALFISR